MHVFFDRDGLPVRVAFTGPVRIAYTALVSRATYAPNSSGRGTTDLLTGETVVRGGNGAIPTADGGWPPTAHRARCHPISVIHHQASVCEALGTTAA
jgi:hypothetical protein